MTLGAVALVLALSGCSWFSGTAKEKVEPLPLACPRVSIDKVTSHLTRFRDGPGRDITDKTLEAEITGFTGDCGRTKTGEDVTLTVAFSANRGPAAKERTLDIPYFVAVSRLAPLSGRDKADGEAPAVGSDGSREREILSKQIFRVASAFPEGINTIRFRDEDIVLELRLSPSETARGYTVHLGFQLTPEEIEYNRGRLQ
ncbi:MAG: hypothetical protein HQL33_01460 [Alphaproteobacteria bacterium]|nr:hypothetical protein [Alphaproteobacteria bacterium]MBF0128636.1 hypothetical protein [Alphaproteobacteria bacterium]